MNGQNEASIPQWRHFRDQAGGGSLVDVGLYCLNAARYVTGEEPVEITAQLTQPKDDPRFREIEDICSFTLRFPSGVIATGTSAYSLHKTDTLRVALEAASIGLDPAFVYGNLSMSLTRKVGQGATATDARDQRRWPEQSQFAREMDHFAMCIRTGTTPHTPGEEGLQDTRLIAAIYQAAQGAPIHLPPVAGLDLTRGPPPAGM